MGFLDDLQKKAKGLGNKVVHDAERAARQGVEGVVREAVKPAERKAKEVGAAAKGHAEKVVQDPEKAVKDGAEKAGQAVGAGVDAVKDGAGKVWNFLKENHEKHKDDPPPKGNDYLGSSEGAAGGKPASLFADNLQGIQNPATSAQGTAVQVAASAKLDVPTVG